MTRDFVGKTSDIPEGKMIHIQIDKKERYSNCKCWRTVLWHARWDITSGKMMILFPEKLKSLRSFKVIVQNDNLCIKRD
jgi:hypothetical protein